MVTQHANCTNEWFEMICESLEREDIEISGVSLPGFPENQIQINTTGQAGRDSLYEAFIFYQDCIKAFSRTQNFRSDDKKLLDFGVGWGRILRFFIKDFFPENLFGVDINEELLNICKSTFKWGTFLKSQAFPPINLPEKSIDFIIGYSVFSHLSEEACLSWINEFSSILRPGGMIALTTRGRWFLDFCEALKTKKVEGYKKALSNLFDDFDKARQKYDNGEFLHSNIEGVSGGRGAVLNPSFYGETFIPEQYAKKTYSPYFKAFDFVFDQSRSVNPIMFFRK